MRIFVVVVAALSLLAGSALEVSAKEHSRAHRRPLAERHFPHALPYVAPELRYPDASGWYPHDANKLPFGSAIWWDQMRRERRLGGSN
jgi:hypothetical protein